MDYFKEDAFHRKIMRQFKVSPDGFQAEGVFVTEDEQESLKRQLVAIQDCIQEYIQPDSNPFTRWLKNEPGLTDLEKENLLLQMAARIHAIDRTFNSATLNHFPVYRTKVKGEFYEQIKRKLAKIKFSPAAEHEAGTLAALIAVMDQDKARKFANILRSLPPQQNLWVTGGSFNFPS